MQKDNLDDSLLADDHLDDCLNTMSNSFPLPPFLVDIYRAFHSTLRDSFTCWNTKERARETNYGTRIDYILSTRDFARKAFQTCNIRPDIMGSDHCPVECALSVGFKQSLVIPHSCSQFMPELSGKQQLIKSYFSNKNNDSVSTSKGNGKRASNPTDISASCKRQKMDVAVASDPSKSNGSSLLSYFGSNKRSQAKSVVKGDSSVADFFDNQFNNIQNKTKQNSNKTKANQWKNILKGPKPPPLCSGHKEACILQTVKKEGPNVGRQFYCCRRPSGHATNTEARCKFFKWKE